MKYYKGEQINPYEGKDQNKAMLWFYERYNQLAIENTKSLSEYISDYIRVGLSNFEESDNVPLTLKALLFNRFAKGCQSLQEAIEPFEEFYVRFYKEEE